MELNRFSVGTYTRNSGVFLSGTSIENSWQTSGETPKGASELTLKEGS